MTEQIKDKIRYREQDYCHIDFIFPFKNEIGKDEAVNFPYDSLVAPHTALTKGFQVSSEVIDKKLVITEFRAFVQGEDESRKKIEISDVIKNAKLPLFASWFSGKIKCFLGNDLVSCEEIVILHFEKGLLTDTSGMSRRRFFRNISIRHILEREINNVKLSFEHTKGFFREIRLRGQISWIESFTDDDENFQTYDEISRDAESVTMSLKNYEPNDSKEYLVKTLLDEGKMQYSIDNGKSWNYLYEVAIKKIK
jgi:hypothetical protein